MKILMRCAVFALLACTVPLPYFTLSRGFGIVPLLAMVLLAVIPELTVTKGATAIVLGVLQALVWVALLWAIAGHAQRRFASVSGTGRMIPVLALIILAFLPIYTTPGDEPLWASAVALQGWALLLALLSAGATM